MINHSSNTENMLVQESQVIVITDVEECLSEPSICGPNSTCINTVGGYSCSCRSGFNITNSSLNVDECLLTPSVCGPNSTSGGYSCSCRTGFTATSSDLSISIINPCIDVDECTEIPEVCGPNANCANTVGNYSCTCLRGYTVTDQYFPINISNPCRGIVSNPCTDVDECTEIPEVCGPNANCANTVGNYSCTCLRGYTVTDQYFPINISNPCRELTKACWRLLNRSLEINTPSIQLKKNNFSNSFNGTFGQNLTTQIEIPGVAKNEFTFITIIVFEALDNILPVRNATSNGSSIAGVVVNGNVAAVILNNTVQNISLNFDLNQTSLGNPQCVFWNFSLLDGIGGWDSTGCKVQPIVNQTGKFKCECDHATPFSILMSPFFLDNPALAYITYIGVGISMGSLILCLIIEGIIWKTMTRNDTSYMRHVSIVNIALSLLIANICFIIGAAIVKEGGKTPVGPCSTATFFIHFFYLALFFWMLLSALLLLYRTVMVFSGMSKCKMMAIAFTVGYGAPLLIAVITVAVTAGGGGYIQEENACWLNWFKTKALLAFVIPALTIVAVNLLVLVVVLYKMLRRGVGAATQPDEKHALVVIARCVAILTPFFGLTWGFGIGTMVSSALGVHIVFAILNSLQVECYILYIYICFILAYIFCNCNTQCPLHSQKKR
uniref:Uncharacterized protein n=1 Tax=Pygocentrus nattereri TaxID=42514 RepID=A0A3B4BSP5_PYGNA